jgi:uncharacterized protein YyaL (SSP411 family)
VTLAARQENKMDIDELSEEAYSGIILEAESFDHNLTLQFGLLSYECDSEEEYLKGALELMEEIKKLSRHELEDIFFGAPFNRKLLFKTLDKIIINIGNVNIIPIEKRIVR